ncbi:MAG: hypothetical protein ACYDEQ_05800, partial [Desulfocucumaceae bacterium]
MKKTLKILTILLLALGISSCTALKKPSPQQNKTIIVPEASRLSFDAIPIKTAPKMVRDIAKTMENRDSTAWAHVDKNSYVIISSGEKGKSYDVVVDEILQRLPEQGFIWLDVRYKYKKRGQPRGADEAVYTVVRADMSNSPSGVGFTISGTEDSGAQTDRSITQTTPSAPPPLQNTQTYSLIEQ